MKTIIKDLTGEMPVDESLHDNIANVLRRFDECTTTSRYGDAIESLVSLLADKPKGKPIEFVWYINVDEEKLRPTTKPSDFSEINLIYKDYDGYDIFIAVDKAKCKYQYHGHWNDGFVEGNDN